MSRSCRSVLATCVIAFLLVGCATSGQKMGAVDKIYGYSLAGVDVTVSKDAYTGVFERADNIDDEEFAKQVEEKLEVTLVETIAPSFSGDIPAKVLVHVDEMDIASGIGRAVVGNESYIGGKVDVVDASTNEIIAEEHFREREKDVSFSGNVGVLFELTKNIIDAVSNDRIEEAAREFAERVKQWLDS